jgi:hypothetical protein
MLLLLLLGCWTWLPLLRLLLLGWVVDLLLQQLLLPGCCVASAL